MSETTIIHLTDLHIEAETGEPFFLAADTTMQTLRQTLDYLRERGLVPGHPVIITGDLVMHNERESYTRLRAVLEEVRAWGSPVLLGLGNHDERAAFRAVMLGDETTDPAQPYYHAEWFGGLRIVVLDSSTVADIPCVAVPGTAFIAEQREDGHHLLRWAGVNVVTVRGGVVEIKPLALPGSQETVRMLSHEQMQAAVAAHA